MLGCKSHGGLCNAYGRNSLGGEQNWRPEGFNEYCSPEMAVPSEAVEGMIVKHRPDTLSGKVDVLWEETAECTTEATGVGVLASKKSFSEITTGRSYFQLGWQQPAKTCFIGYNRRRCGGFRTGA